MAIIKHFDFDGVESSSSLWFTIYLSDEQRQQLTSSNIPCHLMLDTPVKSVILLLTHDKQDASND